MMKIAVFGAKGRVGSAVCRLAKLRGHEVVAIDKESSADNCEAEVAIDFSLPQATEQVCKFCLARRIPLVTGVTGRNNQQQQLVEQLAQSCTVVESSNFSIGIAALKEVCAALAPLGWDCDIVERHQRTKKDSPSGTALGIAAIVSQRGKRVVQIHCLRSGTNFGQHTVVFGGEGESLVVTHQAENVEVFARGALLQAELCQNRQNGDTTQSRNKNFQKPKN